MDSETMAGCFILVVDDDKEFLEVIRGLLEPRGYLIREVATSERALRLLESVTPDLLLLNVRLPGVDAASFGHLLKERGSPVRLVLMGEDVRPAWSSGRASSCGFLQKSWSRRRLLSTIQREWRALQRYTAAHIPSAPGLRALQANHLV